jgi:hypothetical protein
VPEPQRDEVFRHLPFAKDCRTVSAESMKSDALTRAVQNSQDIARLQWPPLRRAELVAMSPGEILPKDFGHRLRYVDQSDGVERLGFLLRPAPDASPHMKNAAVSVTRTIARQRLRGTDLAGFSFD